jgi:hypothetical protein
MHGRLRMRSIGPVGLTVCVFLAFGSAGRPARSQESVNAQPESSPAVGTEMSLQGEVLATYDNALVLVKGAAG